MTAMSVAQRMTADEFLRLPENPFGFSRQVAFELGHGESLTSPLLAGFALAIAELFSD
jgi:hypothetical protein